MGRSHISDRTVTISIVDTDCTKQESTDSNLWLPREVEVRVGPLHQGLWQSML